MHKKDAKSDAQSAEATVELVTFIDLVYRRHAFTCAGVKLETVDSRLTTTNPEVIESLSDNPLFKRV